MCNACVFRPQADDKYFRRTRLLTVCFTELPLNDRNCKRITSFAVCFQRHTAQYLVVVCGSQPVCGAPDQRFPLSVARYSSPPSDTKCEKTSHIHPTTTSAPASCHKTPPPWHQYYGLILRLLFHRFHHLYGHFTVGLVSADQWIALQYEQATGLDARASRVKWPAQFMSHWYGILFTE